MNILAQFDQSVTDRTGCLVSRCSVRAFHSGRVDRQRRQPLCDIVMQLTCDSASLVLMHHQQSSTQRRGLAFSATTPESLPEQPCDQRTLQQHDRDAGHQVRSVLLPDRWFTESHLAARWQTGLPDAPALQLLPVVNRGSRAQWRRLDGARRLAVQHADGNTGGAATQLLIRDESATHDTPIDIGGVDSEDRCICCIVNVLEATRQRTRNSRSIYDKYRIQDCGMRRQFGDALLHLFEGQLIEPDELDPVHEGLELATATPLSRISPPERRRLPRPRGLSPAAHRGCSGRTRARRGGSQQRCRCLSVRICRGFDRPPPHTASEHPGRDVAAGAAQNSMRWPPIGTTRSGFRPTRSACR